MSQYDTDSLAVFSAARWAPDAAVFRPTIVSIRAARALPSTTIPPPAVAARLSTTVQSRMATSGKFGFDAFALRPPPLPPDTFPESRQFTNRARPPSYSSWTHAPPPDSAAVFSTIRQFEIVIRLLECGFALTPPPNLARLFAMRQFSTLAPPPST